MGVDLERKKNRKHSTKIKISPAKSHKSQIMAYNYTENPLFVEPPQDNQGQNQNNENNETQLNISPIHPETFRFSPVDLDNTETTENSWEFLDSGMISSDSSGNGSHSHSTSDSDSDSDNEIKEIIENSSNSDENSEEKSFDSPETAPLTLPNPPPPSNFPSFSHLQSINACNFQTSNVNNINNNVVGSLEAIIEESEPGSSRHSTLQKDTIKKRIRKESENGDKSENQSLTEKIFEKIESKESNQSDQNDRNDEKDRNNNDQNQNT